MSTMARIMDDLRRMEEANEYLKSQVRVMKEIIQSGEAKPLHCKTCKHFVNYYVKTGKQELGTRVYGNRLRTLRIKRQRNKKQER